MSCNAKKDPNGTWRIQYRWTDWTGTKKKSQKRGFKTKKEAEEWHAHFILQQSSDPTMTLANFWEIYKADMEKRLRKTTIKQKEYVMNDKILPYFGKTPINEITAPMICKCQCKNVGKVENNNVCFCYSSAAWVSIRDRTSLMRYDGPFMEIIVE